MKLTVKRAFCLKGERQDVGSVIDVPELLGRELMALQKATPEKPLAVSTGPMTTKSAAAIVGGGKRASNAD